MSCDTYKDIGGKGKCPLEPTCQKDGNCKTARITQTLENLARIELETPDDLEQEEALRELEKKFNRTD